MSTTQGFELPVYTTAPDYTETVELDGVQYRLRFVWRRRTRSWYLDISLLDGTRVVAGRRLSPGYGPLYGTRLPNAPPGFLYVRGVDPYERAELGTVIRLVYYPSASVRAVAAPVDTSGLIVVL